MEVHYRMARGIDERQLNGLPPKQCRDIISSPFVWAGPDLPGKISVSAHLGGVCEGVIIAELYPESRFLRIVKYKTLSRQYALSVRDILLGVVDTVKKEIPSVRHIVFDANNPLTSAGRLNAAVAKLRHLEELGAGRLRIPYERPGLRGDKPWDRRVMLCTLPEWCGAEASPGRASGIPRDALEAFLDEFYQDCRESYFRSPDETLIKANIERTRKSITNELDRMAPGGGCALLETDIEKALLYDK